MFFCCCCLPFFFEATSYYYNPTGLKLALYQTGPPLFFVVYLVMCLIKGLVFQKKCPEVCSEFDIYEGFTLKVKSDKKKTKPNKKKKTCLVQQVLSHRIDFM
jgi:hypothetical protein